MSDRIADWPIHDRTAEFIGRMRPELQACGAQIFTMKECRIIVSNEPQGWHLSISCPDRDPTWAEIVTARYRLLPNVPEMAMFLPPLDEYVNLHPFTFHLHEQKRSALILP